MPKTFEEWLEKHGYGPVEFENVRAAWDAAVEQSATAALEQRCDRSAPWDLACTTIADSIRALKTRE